MVSRRNANRVSRRRRRNRNLCSARPWRPGKEIALYGNPLGQPQNHRPEQRRLISWSPDGKLIAFADVVPGTHRLTLRFVNFRLAEATNCPETSVPSA